MKIDDDYGKYEIIQKNEIVYIFRSLMESRDLVSASFNHGKNFMLTAVVGVDPKQNEAFLDFGSIEEQNRKIIESEKIIFVTSHDKVKIQFNAYKIEKTTFEGQDAFKIKLPDSLIRLQRREYYRLLLPAFSPLQCALPIEGGDTIEPIVVDISIGGINITLPPIAMRFEPGMIFHGCEMELPDIGIINADIKIVNMSEVTLKNEEKSRRAGCCFVNLPPKMQSMIQRFIIKMERKRLSMQQDREL